ncbi:MAG: hypothetical protein MJ060_04130 [Clostridia bacterium]|nr:hypothetical protein [Clostridia bacterium]
MSSIVIFIIAWRLLKKNSRRELLKLPAGSFDAEKDQAKILENKIQQLVSIAEDKELSELREQLETLKQKIRYRKFERICSVTLIVNLVIVLLGYGFWIGFYLFII